MITQREFFMIHELKAQGLSISEIARRLCIDRKTVRKYLQSNPNELEALRRQPRPGKLTPYHGYLCQRLREYPQLTTKRLLREIQQRGYKGGYSILADYVHSVRPAAEADYEIRYETAPGHQAQVDFAHFETEFLCEPKVRRRLYLFAMVLGHSRYLWGQFCENQKLQTVLAMHIGAFEAFEGAPKQVLYDRMKTAVIGEQNGEVRYNLTLQSLLLHYGALPRACHAYRAKTKGKVERVFRYVRQDFFAARDFENLEHLNGSFQKWRNEVANQRCHGTTGKIIAEAFAAEQPALEPLPLLAFETILALERKINREGWVSYDGNRYSVPDGTGVRQVEVHVLPCHLQILANGEVIARHAIPTGKGHSVIDPDHRKARQAQVIEMPGMENTAPLRQRSLSFYRAVGDRLAATSTSVRS